MKVFTTYVLATALVLLFVVGRSAEAGTQAKWNALNEQAVALELQHRYEEALKLHQESLNLAEREPSLSELTLAQSSENVGRTYSNLGKFEEAIPFIRRALELREKLHGSSSPAVAGLLYNLAELYHSQKKYTEAESLYKRSMEMAEKDFIDDPDFSLNWTKLEQLYREWGKNDEADTVFSKQLQWLKRTFGPSKREIVRSLHRYADELRKDGLTDGAKEIETLARRIHKAKDGF